MRAGEDIMTREEILALFARFQHAVAAHDAAALASLHADTCVMESPTAGGSVTGLSAIAQVFDTWFTGFPDLFATFEDLLIDGARVVQSVTFSGTDTGGFLGLPPTGKPFRMPMLWLFSVKDQVIVHSRPIYDFTGLLVQIGVLKTKPV
jgi:steroid delta-isomerase-like uncharacterized protein